MIKVKVSTTSPLIPHAKMTPGSTGVIGEYRFLIDEPAGDADWWVVVHALPAAEKTLCPKENTILITQETESVKTFRRSFTKQFHWIVTCQKNLKHPRKIYYHQGHQSYLFLHRRRPDESAAAYRDSFPSYDRLRAMTPADLPKSKQIAAVVSHKLRTEGAQARYDFLMKLKEHFGDRLDIYSNRPGVFGPETKVAGLKWDALSPYRYVVSIENSFVPHWWTNHLFDAFIAGAYPFYYGHPSVFEYFPKDALTPIDIHDAGGSIAAIEAALAGNFAETRRGAVWEARRLALDKYNLLQVIADVISRLPAGSKKRLVAIKPERNRTLELKQALIRKIQQPLLRRAAKTVYHAYRFARYGEPWPAKKTNRNHV